MGTDQSIEFIVIGGYLVVLLLLGVVFRKFNTNVDDYFRNGCRGTWWLVGMSAFMMTFSAWTFTGAAGVAFLSGWSVLIIFGTNVVAFLINAAWLAPWFRQLRSISSAQIIEKRFGTSAQQCFGWIMVSLQLVMSALHLYGVAIFSAVIFGYDVQLVAVLIGCVVLFYSLVGGSWAVMATDFVQGIILIPMTVLVAVLCLMKLGGIGGFLQAIQDQGLTTDYRLFDAPRAEFNYQFTYVWAAALFIKNTMVFNSMSHSTRYFGVKTGWDARKAALLSAALMAAGCFVWFIPPMAARLLYADAIEGIAIAKPAEASYAIASLRVLPLGMTGLMAVAIFAATMSSMDSGLNRNAAILTNDLTPAICRLLGIRTLTGRAMFWLGQGFTFVMGLAIIGIALYFSAQQGEGIFELMLTVGAVLGVPLITPLFLGLFIKRTPPWAAIFSVACAAVPSAMGVFSGSDWFTQSNIPLIRGIGFMQEQWLFQTQVLVNLAVGSAAFIGSMLFWRFTSEAYRRRVDEFFTVMKTPVDFEKEVGHANDTAQARVIGGFCVAIGACCCLLLLLPNSWGLDGRLGILFVAGSIVAAGCLLIRAGRKEDRRARARDSFVSPSSPSPLAAADE